MLGYWYVLYHYQYYHYAHVLYMNKRRDLFWGKNTHTHITHSACLFVSMLSIVINVGVFCTKRPRYYC